MDGGCLLVGDVDHQNLFKRGVPFGSPSVRLHGENDPFYKISHSRANIASLKGHQINAAPGLWTSTMETYLEERRLPGRRR